MKVMFAGCDTCMPNQNELTRAFIYFCLEYKRRNPKDSVYICSFVRRAYDEYKLYKEQFDELDIILVDYSESILIEKYKSVFDLNHDMFENEIEFDKIILFNGMFKLDYFDSYEQELEQTNEVSIDTTEKLSKFNHYIKVIEFIKRYKNSEMFHIVVDPLTCDWSKYASINERMYYGEDSSLLFELYLFQNMKTNEKCYDFIFGYRAGPEREYISRFVERSLIDKDRETWHISGDDSNIDLKNPMVSQTEYYSLLSKSKFSLVFSSNDRSYFSMIRVFECLSCGCIPIIHSECDELLDNAFIEYGDLLQFIRDNHLVYYENASERQFEDYVSSLNYDSLWKEVESLDSYKNLKNKKIMIDKIMKRFE